MKLDEGWYTTDQAKLLHWYKPRGDNYMSPVCRPEKRIFALWLKHRPGDKCWRCERRVKPK